MRDVGAACVGLMGWILLLGCGSSDETDGASTTPSAPGAGASGTGASGSGASGGASPSSGAGPTGIDENGSITVGGEERSFVLSVPDGYDPETPTRLVFAWHGLGGDGALARLYFGVEQASGGAAIFVYPDGLVVQPQNAPGWQL